jgi:hypothetical protein
MLEGCELIIAQYRYCNSNSHGAVMVAATAVSADRLALEEQGN